MALDDDFYPWTVALARLGLWIQAGVRLLATCVLAALWNGLARSGVPGGLIALLLAVLLAMAVVDIICVNRLRERSRRGRVAAIAAQTVTMAAVVSGLLVGQNSGSGGLICVSLFVLAVALTVVFALTRPQARGWLTR